MPQDVREHIGRKGCRHKAASTGIRDEEGDDEAHDQEGAKSAPLAEASEERLGKACTIRADRASRTDLLLD
jgi:hypothetical protein